MYKVTENDYKFFAQKVYCTAKESHGRFEDTFENIIRLGTQYYYLQLHVNAIVYYKNIDEPEGRRIEVKKIVPIWSELKTYNETGDVDERVKNTFSWDNLYKEIHKLLAV